jgi:hypothetical protein
MFPVGPLNVSVLGFVCNLHSQGRIPPSFYSTSISDAVTLALSCLLCGIPLAGNLEAIVVEITSERDAHEATKHFAPIKRVSKFRPSHALVLLRAKPSDHLNLSMLKLLSASAPSMNQIPNIFDLSR